LGVPYYSLIFSINPSSYLLGVDLDILRKLLDVPLETINPQEKIELLGINYIAHTKVPPTASSSAFPIATLGNRTKGPSKKSDQTTIYLFPVSLRPLVEPLPYLPQTSDQNFADWWQQANMSNIYIHDQLDYLEPNTLNLSQPQISHLNIYPQKITFSIDSANPTPVFIKFAYHPYWRAVDSNHNPLTIYWAAPGYMFILGQGSITLTWSTPIILTLFGYLSWITTIAVLILTIKTSSKKV
jgi:hypothetical protein